uniref:Uncharacterized protein n=1 Tax=Lepeophtheirus salmonis TaxID=72036 RepID=A0A0K2V9R2_LEPSM
MIRVLNKNYKRLLYLMFLSGLNSLTPKCTFYFVVSWLNFS